MFQHHHQREQDALEQKEIEAMIAAEDDPKVRLNLMVMNRINLNLIAHAKAINDVAYKLEAHMDEFRTHAKTEDAMVNKGKGAWRVFAWAVGMAQCAGIWMFLELRGDLHDIHESLEQDQIAHVRLDARINNLENKK